MNLKLSLFLVSLFIAPLNVSAFAPKKGRYCTVPTLAAHEASSTALCLENDSGENIVPGSVGSLLQAMIKSSQFVYTYGTIRRVVATHDNDLRNSKAARKGLFKLKRLPLVNFYRPDLVITQRGSQDDDPGRFMKYSVTGAALLEFLSNNRQYLKQNEKGGDVEFQQLDAKSEDLSKMYTEDNIENFQKFDGEIVDYMDEETNKFGLVYGITINRTMKRVTVVFRGTVGGTDLLADANFNHNREYFADVGTDVKVHSGFSGYLFKKIPGETRTKYDRIVAALKGVYDRNLVHEKDRDEYKVVVSGHSLGGALANLFAFTLSVREGDSDCPLFKYIRAVTFAAPVVGNKGYDNAFREQEAKGKLNMIRVSNEGDWVPTNPSPYEYTQNGVNMHVRPRGKEMELEYRNKKSLLSQFDLNPLEKHLFPSYSERLFQDDMRKQPNFEVLDYTFEEVYESVVKNIN
jgi:hypothetical protein